MKILFDHCTPRPLRRFLTSHNVTTADQHGWSRLRNGDLLNAAERNGIDIFITTDQNMEHAQDFQRPERPCAGEPAEETRMPDAEASASHGG